MRVASLVNQTVDETKGTPLDASDMPYLAAYVDGMGTISGGVITLEEASYSPGSLYAGTWSEITTVDAIDVSGGAQLAVHLAAGGYGHVRARISTTIAGGGNVSVFFEGTGD